MESFLEKELTKASAEENKLSRLLKKLEHARELTSKLYNRLRPSGTQPPRIYGLPKIHKHLVPLRPIVSCINSPTYASIISPLAGQTDSLVRNSQHFVEEMSRVTLAPDELLVSFDVCSLSPSTKLLMSLEKCSVRIQS